jgi:hypothetical protein
MHKCLRFPISFFLLMFILLLLNTALAPRAAASGAMGNVNHLHIQIGPDQVTVSRTVEMKGIKYAGYDYDYIFTANSSLARFDEDAWSVSWPTCDVHRSSFARGCTLQYFRPENSGDTLGMVLEYQYRYPDRNIGSILYEGTGIGSLGLGAENLNDGLDITCNRPVQVWADGKYSQGTHVACHLNYYTHLQIKLPLDGPQDLIEEKVYCYELPPHREHVPGMVKSESVTIELTDAEGGLYRYRLSGIVELNVDTSMTYMKRFFAWFPNQHTNASVCLDLLFDAHYWWEDSIWQESLTENLDVEQSTIRGQPGFYVLIPMFGAYSGRTIIRTCRKATMRVEIDTLHSGNSCDFILASAPQESCGVEFRIPERYHFRHWSSPFAQEENRWEDGFKVKKFYGRCPFGGTASVEWSSLPAPEFFALSQNSPNPFNQETVIRYYLPEDCHVKLHVYNILGQRIRTLVDEAQKANDYQVSWDGKNQQGQDVASGVYLYKLDLGWRSDTRRMLLVK